MSCLCRPGECTNLTYGLHCHMDSSGWSPGLWWRSNSPGDARLVKFCGMGFHHFGNPHDNPHCKCDKGEGDRCPGDALGKCLGCLSFRSLMSYSHSGKMIKLLLGRQTLVNLISHHQGYQDHLCLLISHNTCQDRDSLQWWVDQCDDWGPTCWRWVLIPGSDGRECLYWVAKRQQECHCGNEK